MGRIRTSGRFVAAALAVATLGAQPVDVSGTLPEHYFPELAPILREALEKSPRVLEREIEIEEQEARVIGANAARLPRLGGDLSYAYNRTAVSGQSGTQYRDDGLFYRLELSQSLFHWGALRNETERARMAAAIAEKNYAEAYRLLAVALRSAYVELVAAKLNVRQQRQRQRLREAALATDREKLASGTISPGQVERQALAVREAALALGRAELHLTTLCRGFARLAGLEGFSEESIPDALPRPAHSAGLASAVVAPVLRENGRSAFEAQVHALNAREADLRLEIARVRLLPKFNATAGYYLENTTNATMLNVTQQGVERQGFAINAQWSIFDGLATRGARQEALAAKRLAERRLATAAGEAVERVQSLQRLLEIEAEAMELAEERRVIVAGELARTREEADRGNAPPSRVEQVAADLDQQEANAAMARASYLRVWSELVSLAGADPVLNNLPASHVRNQR